MYALCLKKKLSVNDYVADFSRVYSNWVQDKQEWEMDGWTDDVSWNISILRIVLLIPMCVFYMEIDFSQLI